MASIRNLKKDINYVLGDIIENAYVWELENPKEDKKKTEKIIDEAIVVFDDLINKIYKKDISNKKAHFSSISKELEEKANALATKINNL